MRIILHPGKTSMLFLLFTTNARLDDCSGKIATKLCRAMDRIFTATPNLTLDRNIVPHEEQKIILSRLLAVYSDTR